MQRFVEKNLTKIHDGSVNSNAVSVLSKIVFGMLLICIIPYIHIGVIGHFVWPSKPAINRSKCGCTCFDTVFRGSYENQPGSSYKHWYFNATLEAYKIWCLVIIGVITAYECFKYILSCVQEKDARYSMMLLFVTSVFPHYYSWWNYFNYYNEQFYTQWYHQLYFTVSEFISTGFVLYLIKASRRVESYHILFILSINISHIVIGGIDQFIENILFRRGHRFQVVRDFGLVLPDFLAVFLVLYEIREICRQRNISVRSMFYKEELMFTFLITSAMVVIGKNL